MLILFVVFAQLCGTPECALKLRQGDGVARDAKRALEIYLDQCQVDLGLGKNDQAACRSYAEMAAAGEGIRRSLVVADHTLERACDAGDRKACVARGELLLEGVETPEGKDGLLVQSRPGEESRQVLVRNAATAQKLFSSSCEAGEPRGCVQLGLMRMRGDDGKRDPAAAVQLLRKACQQKDPDGCQMVGVIYGSGAGDGKQEKAVLALLDGGCRAKQASACYGLGLVHRLRSGAAMEGENGGTPHAPGKAAKQAVSLIARACELGDRRACHDLGVFAERGTFGPASPEEARRRYRQACAGGFALSCFNLGVELDPSTGSGDDAAGAESHYRRSCGLGETNACYNLAWLLLQTAARQTEAVPLLDELCGRDHGEACNKLGNLALKGEAKVMRDVAAALRWFRRACNDGLAMGCGNLGTILLSTETPSSLRDEKAAFQALSAACGGGYGPSCEMLRELKRQ